MPAPSPDFGVLRCAAPGLLSDCTPTDESYRESMGECEGEDIWYLQFQDGLGPEFYDEPDLTVGCTGGHKVCSDGCAFEPAMPVHPPEPQMRVDYLNSGVYYVETNIVLQPPASFCDDPADTCWNDVNTHEGVDGFEYPYYCGGY